MTGWDFFTPHIRKKRMDIKEQKRELRRHIRAIKPNLRSENYMEAGRKLCDALMCRKDIVEAQDIVAYWPLADELNTGPFIMECIRRGKRVFLPVIVGRDLVFRQFTSYKCLVREPQFGILEPQGTDEMSIESGGKGVVIIAPGMAFTRSGKRLGRGRGFYDKAFASLPHARRIGICYECQVVDEIPTEEHDIMMDSVVSV